MQIHIKQKGTINIRVLEETSNGLIFVTKELHVTRGETYPISSMAGTNIIFPEGVAFNVSTDMFEVLSSQGYTPGPPCCGRKG